MKKERIENIAWVLPRPSRSKYPGSFPLHFEKKLLNLLKIPRGPLGFAKILHPFGGKAEFGIIMDIKKEVNPHIVGDAHNLPFKDNVFDVVILDPPYSLELSKKLYQTGRCNYKEYIPEALRVLKIGGYLIHYHILAFPYVNGAKLIIRIFIQVRTFSRLRCVHIYQKEQYPGPRVEKDFGPMEP